MVCASFMTSIVPSSKYKSRIISSSDISVTDFSLISSPSKLLEVTTVVGNIIFPCSKILFAISIIESSTRDLPIFKPDAFIKVFAMPPPTIILSATVFMYLINSSFVDTFAPPMTATYGLW